MSDWPCDIALLKAELEADEGRRNKRYRCPAGHWTIGCGHNLEVIAPLSVEVWAQILDLYPNVESQLLDDQVYLSDAIIDQILEEDIRVAMASLDTIWIGWRALSENRKRALLNLAFQMGQSRLLGCVRFWRAIRQYQFDRAVLELIDSPSYRQMQPSKKDRVVAQIRDANKPGAGDASTGENK